MNLEDRRCRACEGKEKPFTLPEAEKYLTKLEGWTIEKMVLVREFLFKNYDETVAFVNAVAWISRREDHHPQTDFGYKSCRIRYWTHAVGGLSKNDFICAAKVNRLLVV